MTIVNGKVEDTFGRPVHCVVEIVSKSTPIVGAGIVTANTDDTLKTNAADGTFTLNLAAGNYRVIYKAALGTNSTQFDIQISDDMEGDTVSIEEVVTTPLTFTSVAPNTVWNGVRPGGIEFDPVSIPTTPTLSEVVYSGGHITNELYTYAVSHVTADGETELSATAAITPSGASNKAVRVTLQVSPTRAISKRIWRTDGTHSELRLLATVTPAVAFYDDFESNTEFVARSSGTPAFPTRNSTAGIISSDGTTILHVTNSGIFILGTLTIPEGASDGYVWTSDANGVGSWQAGGGGGGGGSVSSVFGRTGIVTANSGDYTEAKISFSDISTNNVTTARHGLVPKAPNDTAQFLRGDATWSSIAESVITFTDISTNNVSITKHGFVPKAPNDTTKFLRGDGTWAVPPGSGAVTSVFTRTGAVVATTGDYTAAQVTNAFDTSTTRTANTVYSGPTTGSAAAPTFRALVAGDIPSLSSVYLPLAGGTLTGLVTLAAAGVGFGSSVMFQDGSNVLAVRNGTNAQRMDIYGTYTDGSNYKRLSIYVSGGDYFIDADGAGTGLSSGDLKIRTVGVHSIKFSTNATERWRIENNGQLNASTDNSWDIGGSGANRPRTGYFGTSLVTPALKVTTSPTSGYVLTSDSSGNATWQAPTGGGAGFLALAGGTMTGAIDITEIVGGKWRFSSSTLSGIPWVELANDGLTIHPPDFTGGSTFANRFVRMNTVNDTVIHSAYTNAGYGYIIGSDAQILFAPNAATTGDDFTDLTAAQVAMSISTTTIDMQSNVVIENGFQIPTGAASGYVLTSDGSGNASWAAATGGGGDNRNANYSGTTPSYTPSTSPAFARDTSNSALWFYFGSTWFDTGLRL